MWDQWLLGNTGVGSEAASITAAHDELHETKTSGDGFAVVFKRSISRLKAVWWRLILMMIGTALACTGAVGIFSYTGASTIARTPLQQALSQSDALAPVSATSTPVSTTSGVGAPHAATQVIVVDIGGAVVQPGVYQLPKTARINDLLVAAGGFAARADKQFVAKQLNLAARLDDGDKIYVPFAGEATDARSAVTTESPISPIQSATDSKQVKVSKMSSVSINTATLSDLDSLPDIGETRAQKIIDGRPYQSLDDLVEKKVVSEALLEKLRSQLTL